MKTFLILFFALSTFSGVSAVYAFAAFHDAPASVQKAKNPILTSAENISAGAKLFDANCASCHGRDAMGMGNVPALARGAAQQASDGELFWFIGVGSPENGMPPSPLAEKDRWRVVTFLHSLKNQPATNAGDPPAPPAPFTDYRFERPGLTHHILAKDIPAPLPGAPMVGNGPEIVARPEGAWPKVPDGFKVQLFATELQNPRLIRTAPNGDLFVAESDPGKILVFRGIGPDGKAQKSEVFATGLSRPYGIAFYPPGKDPKFIYIGSTDEIVRYSYQNGDLKASGAAQKISPLPSTSRGHWTRDLQFSLDGKKLFAAVGSASNVDDPDVSAKEKNRANILVMNPDGSDLHVYASGIRNPSSISVNPTTGVLWCSTNERDGLGDNLVPDYISEVKEGGFYGWPWWYIGGKQDPRLSGKHPELKEKLIVPDVLLQPHHASLQLTFYEGEQFPAEYRGDIFSSQHGSWNKSVRAGYELIRVPLHQKATASGDYQDFMTGFVVSAKQVWGRPVGVTTAADGSLLVTDDGSNSIWRIVYTGKK